jgi:pimeloyl-ACP methyl ester carboxylesterase
MPAVFVHGVPDTSEVWAPVLSHVDRDDVVTIRLPGFGEPVPSGFGSTMDEYAAFVTNEIRALAEPVDLVGHDWGSLITQRIVSTQPDLIRTWVLSAAAMTDQFTWHDLAQQWQTPEVGEQVMELMTPEAVELVMTDAGHPDPAGMAARVDSTMTDAVLRLYRSAVNIKDEWNPGQRLRERPGVLLSGRDDPYATPEGGRRAAEAAGAPVREIDGKHWAIFEHPDDTARELHALWSSAS